MSVLNLVGARLGTGVGRRRGRPKGQIKPESLFRSAHRHARLLLVHPHPHTGQRSSSTFLFSVLSSLTRSQSICGSSRGVARRSFTYVLEVFTLSLRVYCALNTRCPAHCRFGFHNASTIDSLLDKEDVSLEAILDEDELLQECKAQNTRLIDYFQRVDVLQRLLGYVTGQIEAEDRGRFRCVPKISFFSGCSLISVATA